MALRASSIINSLRLIGVRTMSSGEFGSGAGKGGGSGGSIREAGGGFGKMEAAHEEEYIHKLKIEQLQALKRQKSEEAKFLKHEIKRNEEALSRQKKRLHDLGKESDSD